MKIAIVGCGAVGSFYGARLLRAGQEVHFLLRSDHAVVARDGVRILSIDGDFTARPSAANAPESIGVVDLVIIALKTTANDQFPRLLPPLVGPDTAVLTLQNGLGSEAQLAAVVGAERVFGGLCFVCLNRIAPGVIRHTAHGRIVMGEYLRHPTPRAERLANAFREAGIRCDIADDLERAHWEKLVWNIPFNGLGVAGIVGWENLARGVVPPGRQRAECVPTDELLASTDGVDWARGLMEEVIAIARALGHAIPAEYVDENINRTRCMGSYRASTLLDFENGLPLEIDSLFREPRRQARAAGVPTPRLDTLCAVLEALDEQRKPSSLG
ncbi:MAG: 2-dehydropantoate 2-reductase [Verrucomicrobiales bacterium]|nr:2-dehydropantoate 2-reductase [Verrucomicrobiales bacterium]MCP5527424.1 2-dehydropantoate 2-reductase [Verrucomicrobiales bacterium]